MINYSFFIILGTGRLAVECAEYLKDKNSPISIIIYDVNKNSSSYLRNSCEKLHIKYCFEEKQKLFDSLAEITETALIISAYNPYIIPAYVLNNSNIRAINIHHALLPQHPGRNAEAWAIYEMDEFCGITWHILSENVDKGAIIAQEKIKLDNNITSIKLFMEQNQAAVRSFKGFIDNFIKGNCNLIPQDNTKKHTFHFSNDRPNGGQLDLEWSVKKISAFLRAYDYGPYNVLGKPCVSYNHSIYEWKKYKILKCDQTDKTIVFKENNLIISEGEIEIELLHMKGM